MHVILKRKKESEDEFLQGVAAVVTEGGAVRVCYEDRREDETFYLSGDYYSVVCLAL